MTKKLKVDEITSELASGSVYFRTAQPADQPNETASTPAPGALPRTHRKLAPAADITPASSPASNPDSTADSTPASSRDSSVASPADSSGDSNGASTPDSQQARTLARKQASTSARTPADSLASTLASSGDLADAIYRVVKKTGKHVAYVRTTEREKSELTAVLEGISETHGYKVTETELIRIAICSLLADYAEKGSDSLLMRVVTDLKD
jgi:hypothetical protein